MTFTRTLGTGDILSSITDTFAIWVIFGSNQWSTTGGGLGCHTLNVNHIYRGGLGYSVFNNVIAIVTGTILATPYLTLRTITEEA